MDHQNAISQLLQARNKSEVREILSQTNEGVVQAIFDEIRQLIGSTPDKAKNLSRWWPEYMRLKAELAHAYRVKGIDHRFSGDWAGSAKAFQRAGEFASDSADRFRYQIGAVDALGRAGKVDAAVNLAKRLHKGLLELGEKTEAARVCINAGNALNWHDRYREAAYWYRTGLSEFGEVRNLERAATLLGLSTAELFAGLPTNCIGYANQAEEIFEEIGLGHYARLAELNRAHAEIFSGRADSGLSRLLRLREEFSKESDEEVRVEEFIGDAHLALNRWEEASDAYRTALELPAMSGLKVNSANCWLGIGQAEAALNHPEQADQALLKAALSYRRFGNVIWASIADVQRAVLAAEQGRTGTARKLAKSAAEHLRHGRASYFESIAQLLIAETTIGEAHERSLRRANTLIRRNGYAGLRWRIHQIQGTRAVGARRRRLFRSMVDEMLGHRASIQSTTGSITFFRDKERALDGYLQELLESGSRAAHQEALTIIRKTRAVALLDEILRVRRSAIPESLHAELESLRNELVAHSSPDLPGGPIRRIIPDAEMARLQRRWVEWGHESIPAIIAHGAQEDTRTRVAYVQTGQALFAVGETKASRLSVDFDELRRQLGWLRYELLAPIVDRAPCEERALSLGKTLAQTIFSPDQGTKTVMVSPDRLLWQVPWQYLADLLPEPLDVVLAAALWPRLDQGQEKNLKKTALWYFPTPDLPHIEREAMAFLERYPNSMVCRTADEARSCMAQERVDLLHISAHAQFHRSNPMFSAIALNKGKIFAAEITRANFRVGNVILSACDSGAMSLVNRLEPDGLTRSFLACGASWVVSTQWPLHDVAAELFVDAFYESFMERGDVLRAARAGRTKVRTEYSHPYFWAPFVTYGGYRD